MDRQSHSFRRAEAIEDEEGETSVPKKRLKLSDNMPGMYSEQSRRMMEKMNFDKTKGLGKSSQGVLEPVTITTQKGRKGLGAQPDGIELAASTWDHSKEKLNIPENVIWLHNTEPEEEVQITADTLEQWLKSGPPKLTIDDETLFCDEQILLQILESKSIFDKLDARDMRGARTRSNPFETIKNNIFMNRAAVKMANMDAMFDYMFTDPVNPKGEPLVRKDDLLYFADVCAGPGGFSEYFLWRKGWAAKGFGFTLRNENDFKLSDFIAGTPETFDPFYGTKNDGNIFDPENIDSFTDYVMAQTTSGVHIMMADGGFSVDGQENIQEILSKQLYMCQMIVALNIVQTNGHFVVKLFDLFTPFSVGLIYLMYKCFKSISICKPNTSRPANSERYLVCKWKKPLADTVARHLCRVNTLINSKHNSKDVLELVPYHVMKSDEIFFQYVTNSNNEIGKNQINALKKIAAFSNDPCMIESRQSSVKERCLALWKLSDRIRKNPKISVQEELDIIIDKWDKSFFKDEPKYLNVSLLENLFPSILGWYFVPLSYVENETSNIRSFFLGRGGKDVLHLDKKGRWVPLEKLYLELSPRTLVYAEIVCEYLGSGKSLRTIRSFHIIDGIMLGGVDIRKYSLEERVRLCEKYSRALNKPCKTVGLTDTTYTTTVPIRCKRLYKMNEIEGYFHTLEDYKLKDGQIRLGYKVRDITEPERFCIPKGLLFLTEVRHDYLKMYSKSQRKHYFYKKDDRTSLFPDQMLSVEETIASFRSSYSNRILWEWKKATQVLRDIAYGDREPELLYREDLRKFVDSKNIPQ
ncbi:cap-specific mRNA (nucleoside-2'-O-)-methyltransferase 1 [Uranotaenia lowii]|uniref:cap-specific mRNA (nucleoside-2'-O-)-methyltransferase 1 n=1 Tax=Uranotaenia lowii TaxID=190385 RepID=UPI00247B1015|nr:cap-specific mRNA (nucleoside-2'-O-)-methyltransferase 1 [Uranotaenia lowii]XP_055605259.1 cap-specific mRNA (nucleoside-2'-O-)-methyltransferase 1 [Uranotaenia lowii]